MQNSQKAYERGRNGLRSPKWAPKNSIAYKKYVRGVKDRKKIGTFDCHSCGNELKFKGRNRTNGYGVLEYYRCITCKEDLIRRENGEPESNNVHR